MLLVIKINTCVDSICRCINAADIFSELATKTYSKPCPTPKMARFVKIVNG